MRIHIPRWHDFAETTVLVDSRDLPLVCLLLSLVEQKFGIRSRLVGRGVFWHLNEQNTIHTYIHHNYVYSTLRSVGHDVKRVKYHTLKVSYCTLKVMRINKIPSLLDSFTFCNSTHKSDTCSINLCTNNESKKFPHLIVESSLLRVVSIRHDLLVEPIKLEMHNMA